MMATPSSRIDLTVILKEFLKKWYLFLISISIILIIAALYIKFASKSYKIEAAVLIRTKNYNRYNDPNDFLQGFELVNQEKNFSNEIRVFQSIPMIKEVIKDLNLYVSYYVQQDKIPRELSFSLIDIYKGAPFIVILNENHVQSLYTLFYIQIINENEFSLGAEDREVYSYNFGTETDQNIIEDFKIQGKFRFGDEIQNDYCSFRILLNSAYDPEKYNRKDLFFMFHHPDLLADKLQKSLSVESASWDATIANIKFEGNNIHKSVDFVNGLINKYIQKNLENKNHIAISTIEYIDRQLSSISDTLLYTERELQNFRRDYSVMNIDEKAQQIYSQLLILATQRDEISRKLTSLRQINLYFESNKDSANMIIPTAVGIEDPLLNNLIEELTILNAEKQQMIRNDQLRNPRLITITASIENLKKVISENIKFTQNATTNALQDIDSRIVELNYEFSRLPQTQRQLLGIERKFEITDAVHTSLMEKKIQAQIARASNMPDLEIIEPARYVSNAKPNLLKTIILALFLGLLFPGSYITIRKLLTDIITDTEELKKICSLRQIGQLPQHNKSSENVVLDFPNEPITEAFRTLRSNLDFFLFGNYHKIILITSSLPQEGKSFITLNLATSFAVAQKKTLLLGFDLRKIDDIYGEFDTRGLVGLGSYLINKATLEDIIIPTKIENLDIIMPDEVPPNPVELISSEKTGELLANLKQMYHYVIIDTPPFGLVADAFVLMKYVDLSIFIARMHNITYKALYDSIEEIRDKKLDNIYLLINGIKPGDFSYTKYSHYPYRKKKSKDQDLTLSDIKKKKSKLVAS